jgi:hypothetical protein
MSNSVFVSIVTSFVSNSLTAMSNDVFGFLTIFVDAEVKSTCLEFRSLKQVNRLPENRVAAVLFSASRRQSLDGTCQQTTGKLGNHPRHQQWRRLANAKHYSKMERTPKRRCFL